MYVEPEGVFSNATHDDKEGGAINGATRVESFCERD